MLPHRNAYGQQTAPGGGPGHKQPIELNFAIGGNPSNLNQVKLSMKKKNEAYHHKHSISNSNARSMNNFLNTEPLAIGNKPLNSGPENQQSMGGLSTAVTGMQSDMKQYEDRKKVVAAIYLNTMSSKVNSNAEVRER